MRKRITSGLAALFMAVAAFFLTPASIARADYQSCPNGAMCVWDTTVFSGQWGYKTAGQVNQMPYDCWRFPALGFNDRLSSWYNRTGSNFRIYEHDGCTGQYVYVDNAAADLDGMWGDNAWMDNEASSIWLALP